LLHEKSDWHKNKGRPVIININDEIMSNFIKIIRDRLVPNLAIAMHHLDNYLILLCKSSFKGDDEFIATRGKPLVMDKAGMVEQFEMNLQSFIYLCKARNIVLVLMTMASRLKDQPDEIVLNALKSGEIDYKEFKELFDQFNASIRKKAQENNIRLIDLAIEIPQEKKFLYDIVHYNDNGSIRAAKIIAAQLTR
jgi:hypothetical protein